MNTDSNDVKIKLGNITYSKSGDGKGAFTFNSDGLEVKDINSSTTFEPNKITVTTTKWPADHDLDALYYAYNDILTTQKYHEMIMPSYLYRFAISKVIFNKPATIILWTDGSKTIVKCAEDEIYDAEKGFAMAVCKKLFGSDFKKVFKEHVPEEEETTVNLYADDNVVYTKQQPSEGQKLFDAIKKLNEISSIKYNKK